ncbi:MAG: response regulator [Archangium sp.]|nr:response regulator [Archangium sp.]
MVLDDPTEVEATVAANEVSAIICDKRMPIRSGVDVLLAIKQRFPEIARCLLTGSLSELTQDEVERLGPCVLISKPWTQHDLTTLIRGWKLGQNA